MLKHQLFDGWQVLIDNFILIMQKNLGKSEELHMKMLQNDTLCNWRIVVELGRKDTSSSHIEHVGCSKHVAALKKKVF